MILAALPIQDAPDWNALFAIAEGQMGHFTTRQAESAGYSPQLLYKYLRNGRIVRELRGVYRLVHFPAGEHEDLVVFWLWADQVGVFSHETALALHDLSDVLPAKVHMTLPAEWRRRRLRVPPGLVLHHADVADSDLSNHAVVPITAPRRTLEDCIDRGVSPDLMRQAITQAAQRGLIPREEASKLRVDLDRLEAQAS